MARVHRIRCRVQQGLGAITLGAVACVTGVAPTSLLSLWARFLHAPEDLLWGLGLFGGRPFNSDEVL